MGNRYDCDACGGNFDDGSNHEQWCPGSPDDRIAALEQDVENLSGWCLDLDRRTRRTPASSAARFRRLARRPAARRF